MTSCRLPSPPWERKSQHGWSSSEDKWFETYKVCCGTHIVCKTCMSPKTPGCISDIRLSDRSLHIHQLVARCCTPKIHGLPKCMTGFLSWCGLCTYNVCSTILTHLLYDLREKYIEEHTTNVYLFWYTLTLWYIYIYIYIYIYYMYIHVYMYVYTCIYMYMIFWYILNFFQSRHTLHAQFIYFYIYVYVHVCKYAYPTPTYICMTCTWTCMCVYTLYPLNFILFLLCVIYSQNG